MAKPTKAEQLKAALDRAKIRNELVNRAFAILNEMAVPVAVLIPGENSIIVTGEWDAKFVTIVEGHQKVYTNAEARHALANDRGLRGILHHLAHQSLGSQN